MSEKRKTVLEEFGQRRLFGQDRLFSGPGKSAACAVQPSVRRPAAVEAVDPEVPAGCCEFVRRLVDSTGTARYCEDDSFCPARMYSNSKVFEGCPSRIEKLKPKKELF